MVLPFYSGLLGNSAEHIFTNVFHKNTDRTENIALSLSGIVLRYKAANIHMKSCLYLGNALQKCTRGIWASDYKQIRNICLYRLYIHWKYLIKVILNKNLPQETIYSQKYY